MNMVEFKITQPDRAAEGIVEIARQMRVTCLKGDRFLVAEGGLAVLAGLGIPYTVLAREPFNYERTRYLILRPLKFPDGTPVPAEYITETQIELARRFGVATLEPGRVSGMWVDELPEGQRAIAKHHRTPVHPANESSPAGVRLQAVRILRLGDFNVTIAFHLAWHPANLFILTLEEIPECCTRSSPH